MAQEGKPFTLKSCFIRQLCVEHSELKIRPSSTVSIVDKQQVQTLRHYDASCSP